MLRNVIFRFPINSPIIIINYFLEANKHIYLHENCLNKLIQMDIFREGCGNIFLFHKILHLVLILATFDFSLKDFSPFFNV